MSLYACISTANLCVNVTHNNYINTKRVRKISSHLGIG